MSDEADVDVSALLDREAMLTGTIMRIAVRMREVCAGQEAALRADERHHAKVERLISRAADALEALEKMVEVEEAGDA